MKFFKKALFLSIMLFDLIIISILATEKRNNGSRMRKNSLPTAYIKQECKKEERCKGENVRIIPMRGILDEDKYLCKCIVYLDSEHKVSEKVYLQINETYGIITSFVSLPISFDAKDYSPMKTGK